MSHSKIPLNVVFIIDTYLPHDADELQRKRAVALLKCSLVKILLYFQCNMDSKFQWTHQFFNSRMHQDIGLIPNRVLQGVSMSTIASCVEEYRKFITTEAATGTQPSGKMSSQGGSGSKPQAHAAVSPCFNLRRQLVHSLADFGLDISSYQSPMKPASSYARSHTLQKHFPPVNIRNYMYILTPLPRTWAETVSFLDGKRYAQNEPLAIGPRRNDILEVLKGVKDAFFDQGLWDRFLDQRMSLSWIDTGARSNAEETAKTHTRISATMLIRSTLEQILKAFGGYIIPQKIFYPNVEAKDIYSFATIFQTYRSLQINPGMGVKMSKDSWQALPSTSTGMHDETQPADLIWSGDLLSAQSSKYLCSMDIVGLKRAAGPASTSLSVSDQLDAIYVLERLSSRAVSLSLDYIRTTGTVMCFPQDNIHGPCQHASYLLESLRSKNDVLLLDITFSRDGPQAVESPEAAKDAVQPDLPQQYTRQALLQPTTQGKGIIQIIENGLDLRDARYSTPELCSKSRPFSTAMMEKSWGNLGAFVDEVDTEPRSECSYHLHVMPAGLLDHIQLRSCPSDTSADTTKAASSKPLPGETLDEVLPAAIATAESIDDLCLEIRKSYIEHLYKDEHTVLDYVKRLNAATKEITALAAKQSVPLKEAQQKLVAFIIEFLRIWPSRMTSKYKQLGKEVNGGKTVESKTQDHYVILQDERPELDAWKAEIMKSVKDTDIRMQLRKLKTKDTQIQIVQNLHILLLIDKYGLEENKPFKKDPGALKATNLFMDELCISASLEDRPAPGLMSPQTPRSKDMDSAKKFFTRIVARFYAPSLPKVVEKLSIKCGAEKTFLTSPRSKRSIMKRSMSMGVLQKPRPLDLSSLSQLPPPEPSPSTGASTPNDNVAPKHGFPMSRNSTSDNPARNVLNSSLFRNRQVTMTRGSFKGLDAISSTSGISSSTTQARQGRPVLAQSRSQSAIQRPQSASFDGEMEDEDAPPQLAKLKLKKFYHDKESEEVLKIFRRKGPLSKADAIKSHGSERNTDNGDKEDIGDEGLESPLAGRGTTSWGVINSINTTSSILRPEGLESPSSSAAKRRSSPRKQTRDLSPSDRPRETFNTSLSLPEDSFVPSTPSRKQGYFPETYEQTTEHAPLTPSGRAQFRRYHSQQIFSRQDTENENRDITSKLFVPSTPTRKDQIHQGRTFASQIRGSHSFDVMENGVLGSPGKRRRAGGIESDEDDEGDSHSAIFEDGVRRGQRYLQSPRRRSFQRAQTTSVLSSRSPTTNRQDRQTGFSEAIHPDRKRVHVDGMFGSAEGVPKAVFIPGTPSSKLLDVRSALSYHSSTSDALTVENANMDNGSRATSRSSSTLLMSTPKSMAKSPAIAASHFETFISSPTLKRDAPRRRIDFSLFATDD
ncbi:hypothetical protein EC968_002326 [Mortierella alpina]|nr:hypothetical protein EC968_002326 [Mortierella alpina]